jgi:hypothetical protein
MASWSFASPTCSWFGVTCDAAGHVTELDLSIAGITGRLHAFYSTAYQNLTVLDLNYNNLTGGIPTNISLLVTLTSLDLGTNNLTGAIPYQLSMLPRLAVLNLRSNHLTNPESGKFSPMPSLEVFYLGYNDLHGTFPQFILNSTSRGMLFLQLSGNNDLEGCYFSNIVRKKNATVAQVLSTTPLNISFRRALVGDNWAKWLQLVGSILNVHLGEQTDTFMWTKSESFSVKAMCNDLVVGNAPRLNLVTWKAKVPLKIKIFIWYLWKGVILTKDNLAKRQRKGCTRCCFCSEQETIQHLFFDCPMARLMWIAISATFGITKPANFANLIGP